MKLFREYKNCQLITDTLIRRTSGFAFDVEAALARIDAALAAVADRLCASRSAALVRTDYHGIVEHTSDDAVVTGAEATRQAPFAANKQQAAITVPDISGSRTLCTLLAY